MKQLELFENPVLISKEDQKDASECAILFGEGGQRIIDLNRVSEWIRSIPEGKYTVFKKGGGHKLPQFKGRADFPYVKNNYTGKILSPNFSRSVYPCYTLDNGNSSKRIYAHRLFAMAFVVNEIPNITFNVNHEDEDKLNYSIENLTWVSTAENMTNIKHTASTQNTQYKVYSSENYV